MARPTKLTPDLIERIVKLIKLGLSYEVAATNAGISEAAFYKWKRRGKEELERLYQKGARKRKSEAIYVQFVEALTRANAEAEAVLLAQIRKAGSDDWRAWSWIMERRFPNRWGKVATLHIKDWREEAEEAGIDVADDFEKMVQYYAEQLAEVDAGSTPDDGGGSLGGGETAD